LDKTYWTRKLPAVRLLESLFVRSKRGGDYKDNVLVTSDEDETIDFLLRKALPGDVTAPASEKVWVFSLRPSGLTHAIE
jgi:hypothetical protein